MAKYLCVFAVLSVFVAVSMAAPALNAAVEETDSDDLQTAQQFHRLGGFGYNNGYNTGYNTGYRGYNGYNPYQGQYYRRPHYSHYSHSSESDEHRYGGYGGHGFGFGGGNRFSGHRFGHGGNHYGSFSSEEFFG